MENVLDYFKTLEQHPVQRLLFLVGGLLFFWILEGAVPLLEPHYKKNKTRHAVVNFSFTVMHLVIQTGIAVLIVLLADWCQRQNIGLVHWVHANLLMTIVLSFFVYDLFIGWMAHFALHQTFALWRFHTVHHADNNVDATTGLRHHPVESIIRGVFFLLATVVAGAPVYSLMIYQTILVFFVAFTHANISLPHKVDNALSYFFVSPNMHKVHHHWQQPYTDSNYGAVLSIWDRLFGTYRELEPSQLKYGLDRYYPNEHDENFMQLLKRPFGKMKT
ncbi:sterol desaturase family protein [Flavisolibacter ginsenosidimutans]|uniref:Sterol desaturase family protein n=1 Tax=Flavisolibacter ginsenosidimutans TaxID=661481 RepID=A0A5B8UKM9_9BACT|nr:sterol desaturase family protein [Flavisolibacter ginsenosidimutans]QEC56962.1 sterol desaturase family protein [Flavisolibacter ginsenosidimutans]